MDPIEAWLAGLVHHCVQGDLSERSRHERFLVARMTAGAAALAVVPAYLLSRGVPTMLECLAIIALVAPVASAVLLSRTGHLVVAQAIASVSLAVFAAAAGAAFGGVAGLAVLVLLAVPAEALSCGSARALKAAVGLALLGIPLMALLEHSGSFALPQPVALAATLAVAGTLMASQAAAQVFADRRLTAAVHTALRVGEAREGAMLQAIDDLVTWHDRNGHVLRANAAAGRLLAVPAAALNGRGLFSHIHVSDRPLFLKAISDAAASPDAVVVQFRMHTGERHDPFERGNILGRIAPKAVSQVIWVEMRAHRLDGAGQGDHTVVAITRNISKHRQQAEELEVARAEAEQVGAAKARLLATVSHELRTPLNAIIGFSEILMDDDSPAKPDQRRDYAEIIHDSGHHLLSVVDTLLDMSRIESGHCGISAEELDVDELVHSCCDLMEVGACRAGVAIARDVAPALPEITADRRACRQILINLLSNAVKFTPRGGLITVKARREGDRIVFTVADTGIGVAAQDLPRLGDPFFQAGTAIHRSQPGSGLGLSVVRGLVGLHRGCLTIASASGDGTSVTVSLPIDARTGANPVAPVRVQAVALCAGDSACAQNRVMSVA